MNDDSNSHSYRPATTPAAPNPSPAFLRGTALMNSLLGALKRGYSDVVAGPRARLTFGFLRRHWALSIFLVLLLFPLAGVLLGYLSRPKAGSPSQNAAGITTATDAGEKQAKPSAGKSRMPEPQGPPPSVMHAASPSALEPQAPPSMSVPSRPVAPAPALPNAAPNAAPAPAVAANAPYTPMVYSARHDKVFGEGCAGQLTLDTNGLAFRCPGDPRSSLQLALGDIEAVDGNGVRLNSGKKYHFSIAGMGRSNEEQLFANWLSRVR